MNITSVVLQIFMETITADEDCEEQDQECKTCTMIVSRPKAVRTYVVADHRLYEVGIKTKKVGANDI